jgi:RNA polymerase sigma factor (sigma-70 family)
MDKMMRDGTADPVLWLDLKKGDRAAMEMLYKRHFPVLQRYGNKICSSPEAVKDCLQDLFFQLWVRREALQDVQSVRFYLMKWLKRDLIRNLTGKKGGQQLISLEVNSDDFLPEAELNDFFEESEIRAGRAEMLRQALGQLSNKEREVIYLRFFMHLPYEEISLVMNVGYQVVMNYMHRAMKVLRENQLLKNISGWLLLMANLIFFKISS